MNGKNSLLRIERRKHGWSQQQLADFAEVSLSTVERAERGEPIRVDSIQRLCASLEKDPEHLGLLSEEQDSSVPYTHQNMALTQDAGNDDMKRRQALKILGGVTSAALAASSQELLTPAPWERLSMALARPCSLDEATLRALEAITEGHWQLVYGGIPKYNLLSGVLGHLQSLTQLLQGSSYLTSAYQRLCAISSQQAQIVGEIYFDMRDFVKAHGCFKSSVEAAREAQNNDLYAVALARWSFLTTYNKQFQESLSLIDAANHVAIRHATPIVRSWIAAIEAEVQANLQAPSLSLKALERAEIIVDQPAEKDIYSTKFTSASLSGYKGVCYVRLCMPKEAQTVLNDALKSISKDVPGGQATVLTDLAGTYAQQGEIEQACDYASQALVIISNQNKSVNTLQRIRDLRLQLEMWKSTSHVKSLDEQIADTYMHIQHSKPL